MDTENKTVVFSHRDIVFVFNWHPDRSLPDYPERNQRLILFRTRAERERL